MKIPLTQAQKYYNRITKRRHDFPAHHRRRLRHGAGRRPHGVSAPRDEQDPQKEDLACIGTLGFRGEALAAISSVSKIDLLTRAQGAENGVRLHLEAGQVLSEEPAGCPCGTTILVRELFYNTPARMKFMKSDAAESSAVFSVVQQQALAHPEISFRFLKDGQEQLHTDGQGDRMAAIYAIYGRELANNMLPVDGSWEKLRVRGFVTKPTATRGNRAWQSFLSTTAISNPVCSPPRWRRRTATRSWWAASRPACWRSICPCRPWM